MGHGEGEGDSGVHVRTGDVANRINHHGDDQPTRNRRPQLRDAGEVALAQRCGSGRREHQQKCRYRLRHHLQLHQCTTIYVRDVQLITYQSHVDSVFFVLIHRLFFIFPYVCIVNSLHFLMHFR